ncbi:hypothetical protein AB0J57_02150 [Streptomyces sp. NPDC049837]|uniref:hypothetical protein n=1 Tax=Streptomyces sp. NPDC049837 TaxID=3155277 RepID=UPI00343BEC89
MNEFVPGPCDVQVRPPSSTDDCHQRWAFAAAASDLLDDPACEVDGGGFSVAHAAAAHQVGEQQERFVAGGAYLP